jgi:hypothetical protein
VTGEAVGIAAKLEQSANAGEIVVGELAARLVDNAASLEPIGEIAIKGRRVPVHAYRLVELAAVAPAFESRGEAALVGRKRELAALRRSLKRAVDGGSVRLALVVGPPGVGKSRLAAELVQRAKGVTTLWGRCLSYGDGITYWPLRDAIRDASAAKERDAVLAALEAETPPPAPEIALLFRQLCETLARERPLVLVFDDVHWAEPTFLELLELVAERGEGPILVVCLAREELPEEHPDYLEGRGNVDRIVLDPLSRNETDALLDGLGGAILESDQRARIVDAAEGNPFFLEQLLAHAVEGGLAERELPATVQALLAARLDRLGPGERAVLERGAVVGKDFSADDVVALVDPEAAPTVDVHLDTLSTRGFVRSRGENAYSFRHVLVREAVYRAAPKRLRAELHERFADRLDETASDIPDLDEFVGYHLEQAYRLRVELGESDRHAEQLAEDAGRRLGEGGVRALKRGDMPATINLLRRATSLLPAAEPLRRELLCELGIALRTSGDSDAAEQVLAAAVDASGDSEDRRAEFRARIELEYVRFLNEPTTTADPLLGVIRTGIPIFETVGDERSLGRASLLAGFVLGSHHGQHKTGGEAAERALDHYRRSHWPVSTCVGQIATALYFGPVPVPTAVARCKELLAGLDSDRVGTANVCVFLGGLVAQRGDFDEGRMLVSSASSVYESLGQRTSMAIFCAAMLGEIALLEGDAVAAELILGDLCDELMRTGGLGHLASIAGVLAEALYLQGRLEEGEDWTIVGAQHTATDDLDAQLVWMPVQARIRARRGAFAEAEALIEGAVRLSASSDALNRIAGVYCGLGEIARLAGRSDVSASAFSRAIGLFEEKGNIIGAARVRVLQDDAALVWRA